MTRYIKLAFAFLAFILCQDSNAQTIQLASDTVCINQDVFVSTNDTNGTTYDWHFCSAYLESVPTGTQLGVGTGLVSPSTITMGKDGDDYYVFVINSGAPYDVLRYNFGNSMNNTPTVTNLSNFGNLIPPNARGMQLLKVGVNWYGFVIGGNTLANTRIVRLDYGTSLNNPPVATDLGNQSGLLVNPQDIHVFQEGGNWYAYTLLGAVGHLARLDFGSSITNIPTLTDLVAPNDPFQTGFFVTEEAGNWYMFYINRLRNSLVRLDFGSSILNVPVFNDLGNIGGFFVNPRDVTLIKDCGKIYGYVSNEGDDAIVKLDFDLGIAGMPTATNLGNFGNFAAPRFFSNMLRDGNEIYGFVANNLNNSFTRLEYKTCLSPTLPSYNGMQPPVFQYTYPGTFNIFYVKDENLPTMEVICTEITVLPIPNIFLSKDTLICQGDTLTLTVLHPNLSYAIWSPNYKNIGRDDQPVINVVPDEDFLYNLEFGLNNGCIVDTFVDVKVSKILADAGEDREIADGAYTTLGGPNLSLGYNMSYLWQPSLYLNNDTFAHPISTPIDTSIYYYLTVKNTDGCEKRDTVLIKTICGDFNVPNAFCPTADNPMDRTVGIMNFQIGKLDNFTIFTRFGDVIFTTTNHRDRWDGTFKGKEQPIGVYYWTAEGQCYSGRKLKKHGNITLIR